MVDTVEISSGLLLRMMRLVRIATPDENGEYRVIEHCGILRGRESKVVDLQMAENVAIDPARHFEIDSGALIAAYRAERRSRGLRVMGFFHTHPEGSCAPSERDAECAAPDGKLWAIASNEGVVIWRAVANGAVHGRFDRVLFDLRTGNRVEPGCPGVMWRGMELEYQVKFDLEARGAL